MLYKFLIASLRYCSNESIVQKPIGITILKTIVSFSIIFLGGLVKKMDNMGSDLRTRYCSC